MVCFRKTAISFEKVDYDYRLKKDRTHRIYFGDLH